MTQEENKSDSNLDESPNHSKKKQISIPIGKLLYEDANNKMKKMKQICLTE